MWQIERLMYRTCLLLKSVTVLTFLKGCSQLPGLILKCDQQLAISQKVHIERFIELAKPYMILQTPLILYYVP